jgi:hypothetical protein
MLKLINLEFEHLDETKGLAATLEHLGSNKELSDTHPCIEAPPRGLISLFSHKVHSFSGELGASPTSRNAWAFKQTGGCRCFNHPIDIPQHSRGVLLRCER